MTIPKKLGKLPYKHDDRTFKLSMFLDKAALPAPPETFSLADQLTTWPMYGNDQFGDCTIAAAGHLIELWSRLDKHPTDPSLKTIESVYHKLSPKDEGCVMLDVLKYWRKTGIAAHHLFVFALLDLKDYDHVKLAVTMFGGAYIGLNLPLSAQTQIEHNFVWDVPTTGTKGNGAPGSWGGHCVNIVGYDKEGLTCVTWGQLHRMTWKFWDTYCEEAWALLSKDWKTKPPVNGFDFQTLENSLSQIGHEQV